MSSLASRKCLFDSRKLLSEQIELLQAYFNSLLNNCSVSSCNLKQQDCSRLVDIFAFARTKLMFDHDLKVDKLLQAHDLEDGGEARLHGGLERQGVHQGFDHALLC